MSKDGSQVLLRPQDIVVADNVRTEELEGLDDLAQSISTVGLLSPITVSTNGGEHMVLVAGHRRLAAIEVGIRDGILPPDFQIPAIVNERAKDPTHRTVVQLVENLQRDDLGVMDEARGYQALKDQGVTQQDIASQVGRSPAHVSKRLKLLTLPEDVQDIIDAGELRLEVAIELPGLNESVAREVAKMGARATVRDVKIRKENAKAAITRQKVRDQLEAANITVFPPYGIEVPEGKVIHRGEGVSKVADLPKRIAGVVVNDYATDIELVPITFKAPAKSELERQAQVERQLKADAKARAKEQARLQASADAFIDNPPAAAELLAMLARVANPGSSTFLDTKDQELETEGRTLEGWLASGELSALEVRKVMAAVLLRDIQQMASAYNHTDEEALLGLIDTAVQTGVEFSRYLSNMALSSLARIWQRDEEAQADTDEDTPEDQAPESE